MTSAPVAAIAGVSAAAAYLDAKYHITKDLRGIRGQKTNQRAFEKTGMPPVAVTPCVTQAGD